MSCTRQRLSVKMCLLLAAASLMFGAIAVGAHVAPEEAGTTSLVHGQMIEERMDRQNHVLYYKFHCKPPSDQPMTDGLNTATVVVGISPEHRSGLSVLVSGVGMPSQFHYDWQQYLKDRDEPLYIHSTDAKWPEDNVFFIAVVDEVLQEQYWNKMVNKTHMDHHFLLRAGCMRKTESELKQSLPLPLNESADLGAPLVDTPLTPGLPMLGNLNSSVPNITYSFHMTDHGAFEVSVGQRFGDPDIYVTADGTLPSPSNYQWRSIYYGADAIVVTTNMPHYCSNCVYRITVIAALHHSTQYYILGLSSFTTVRLLPGVPLLVNEQQPNKNAYIDYVSTQAGRAVTISATSLAGDPDLYVSTSNPLPSPTSHQWSATRYGSDALVIFPTCVCTYHINLYAASHLNMRAVIAAAESHPIRLTDGRPQVGVVRSGFLELFEITVVNSRTAGHSKNLTVQLTTTSGRVWFIMSRNTPVNASHYQWHTSPWAGITQVTVIQNSTNCPRAMCNYYIGVEGAGHFSLTASTSDSSHNDTQHTALQPGVPVQETVPTGGWRYFSYSNQNIGALSALTFTVTSLSGDPDLYVTQPFHASPFPSRTDYAYRSIQYGNDTITVPHASVRLGMYYVGVFGAMSAAFTITAGETSEFTTLIDGVPQDGYVDRLTWEYYQFSLGANLTGATLQISLDVDEGRSAATLYVARNHRPTTSSYDKKSNSGDLMITSAPNGTYLIGVYGTQDTDFTIEVDVGGFIFELQEGVAVQDVLAQKNDMAYYMIRVTQWNASSVLRVDVTPVSSASDPDMYVSTRYSHPNNSYYDYRGDKVGGDIVELHGGNSHTCACVYYISVQAYTPNCSYSIVASFPPTNQIILQNGVIEVGNANIGEYQYYMFMVDEMPAPTSIRVILHSFQGTASLFMSTNDHGPPFTWTGTSSGDDDKLQITSSTPGWCTNCTYYIAVQSNPNSPHSSAWAITATAA